jgi:glutamyl-tRNA reductase
VIVVIGLSHRTAPIEVRERLAIAADEIPGLLRSLVSIPSLGEALVVSTCNRVEFVVAGTDGPRADLVGIARSTTDAILARAPGVSGYLYQHVGLDGVRHLFRVAASLDSLVVGEPQILGQVKQSYDLAREVGTTGSVLNRVVPRALRSAKRVRSQTTIGAGQVSVPSVAVDLARQIFGDLSHRTAALIGSGDMGETVARLLRQGGARLIVVGRNAERVREIAGTMHGEPRSFEDLDRTLEEADVVVTTTSAPGFVVEHDRVRRGRRARKGRSLFFIDLAVPRDVDPRVISIDGVFLYNVDDLSKVVSESLESRRREADRAEEIVAEEAASYERWADSEQVTPTVLALRERVRGVLEAELERSLAGKLRHLSAEDRQSLLVMSEASVNKLLHDTTQRLRRMASDPGLRSDLDVAIAVLGDLFDLEALAGALRSGDAAALAADEADLGSDPAGSSEPPASGPNATEEEGGKRRVQRLGS